MNMIHSDVGITHQKPAHFLDIRDFDRATLRHLFDLARRLKHPASRAARPLIGKSLTLIFEKPSKLRCVSSAAT